MDYGSEPKFFAKYKIIGSGTQWQIHFSLFSGLDSRFLLRNDLILSRATERSNGMKSQKWELCPRLILMKRFFRNVAFREI